MSSGITSKSSGVTTCTTNCKKSWTMARRQRWRWPCHLVQPSPRHPGSWALLVAKVRHPGIMSDHGSGLPVKIANRASPPKAAQKLHQFLSFTPAAQRYGSLATTSWLIVIFGEMDALQRCRTQYDKELCPKTLQRTGGMFRVLPDILCLRFTVDRPHALIIDTPEGRSICLRNADGGSGVGS
jgi:hypothetical protein